MRTATAVGTPRARVPAVCECLGHPPAVRAGPVGTQGIHVLFARAYVRRGEAFPAPNPMHPLVLAHELTWQWLANANEVDFTGTERIVLTPAPDLRAALSS